MERLTLQAIADVLNNHIAYTKGLEKQLKRAEEQRDNWRELAEPGWKARELREALDGEIRLLREQG